MVIDTLAVVAILFGEHDSQPSAEAVDGPVVEGRKEKDVRCSNAFLG
jgi:uncharacterized protein with PIN domain